eukprot:m.67284 g.67284  ORF g.67284 m.67284 type:complete len:320 (+) comp13817_c0_seq3:582-1541(+)
MAPTQLSVRDEASGVFSVRFSPDGSHLAVACGDGGVEVKKTTGDHSTTYLLSTIDEKIPVTALCWTREDRLTVAGTTGWIKHWNTAGRGALLHSFREEENEILALDYDCKQRTFATGGKDKRLRLYDAQTNALIRTFDEPLTPNDPEHVFALKFHLSNPNVLVGAGWGRVVKIWDARVPTLLRDIQGPKVCGDSLDLFEDTLLVGSWCASGDEAIQLFDVRFSGREPVVLPFPVGDSGASGAYLYAAKFTKDGKRVVAGGSGTHDAKMLDRASGGNVVAQVALANAAGTPKAVQAVDTSPDNTAFAVAGLSEHVLLCSA